MSYYTKLAIRRPTKVTEILARVPTLPYSVPINGQPAWKQIPLNVSIPYTRPPPNTCCFTKGKAGAKLYPQPPGAPFETCPAPAPEYDSMFDPNLRAWLSRQKHLLKATYPCRKLEIPCSQTEFNRHRKVLHGYWSKMAFLEIRKQDEKDKEECTMRNVNAQREIQYKNALKAKIQRELLEKSLVKRNEEFRLKQEDNEFRHQRTEMRRIRLKERRKTENEERRKRARAKVEKMRQKKDAAEDKARMKVIKALRHIRIKDRKLKKQMQTNEEKRLKNMLDEDTRKWELYLKAQQERMKQKNEFLAAYTSGMKKKVADDLRNKKHAKNWKDELLRSMQLANLKPYSDIEKENVHGMKSKLFQKWKTMLPHDYYKLRRMREPSPADSVVTEAVHSAINDKRHSKLLKRENLVISKDEKTIDDTDRLEGAEYWMNKWLTTPKQVRKAINTILGKVVLKTTIPDVFQILHEVRGRCAKLINKKILERDNGFDQVPKVYNKHTKCITRTPSQMELSRDMKNEKNAPDELARSLAALRRVLTQVIRDHIRKGLKQTDGRTEVTTIPATREPQAPEDLIAEKLAVYVCHTRAKDITSTTVFVRQQAEGILREVLRGLQTNSSTHVEVSTSKKNQTNEKVQRQSNQTPNRKPSKSDPNYKGANGPQSEGKCSCYPPPLPCPYRKVPCGQK